MRGCRGRRGREGNSFLATEMGFPSSPFSPAEGRGEEPRRVMLSSNFRSRPEILSAVNDIFSLCMSSRVGDVKYGEAEKRRPGLEAAPAERPCVELHCLDTKEREEGDGKDDLEARGIRFVLFIPPNKERMYAEYLPASFGERADDCALFQVTAAPKERREL